MGKVKPHDEPQPERPVTIGRAATAAGLSAKAVRLYEARGLLATRPRTAAGYRLYTDADIARLRFIAAARDLGLHVDQIADILAAARDGRQPCATTLAALDQRIEEIDHRIAGLTELRASLVAARDATPTTTEAAICPVIEHAPPRRSASTHSRQAFSHAAATFHHDRETQT